MLYHKRQRLNEFRTLREQDEESKGPPYVPPQERILTTPDVSDSMTEKDASVDQKIDSYLMQYEKEAVPLDGADEDKLSPEGRQKAAEQPVPLSERRKEKYLYRWLFEQDDAAAGEDAGGDAGGGAGGGDDLGGGGETPEPGAEAPVAPVPKINIRKFAEGVARLVNNYQTLVDPKTIILNRAMYYIAKNYSPRLAKEMMSILERDFDLTPKTKSQVQDEYPSAPRQANAGPDSGGGVPSGGGD
jgi:hypothetical protein